MPERRVLEGLTRALRERSPELLGRDLVEMVDEGAEEWRKDDRDLMMALAPYHHCASRIGANPARLFAKAAKKMPRDLRGVVHEFGKRGEIVPAEWKFHFVEGPEGPRYEFDAMTDDEVEAFIRRMRGDD